MRRIWAMLLAGVLASACSAARLDAEIGFGGFYRPGCWSPVHGVVENLGRADRVEKPAAIQGDVIVAPPATDGSDQKYRFPISVEGGDRKRVAFFAKLPTAIQELDVELRSGRSLIVGAKPRVRELRSSENLIVVVKTTEMQFSLPDVHADAANRVVHVSPDQLPDQWYGYDGVDMVVVPRVLEKAFDGPRGEALIAWVKSGGTLLVLGGRWAGSYKASPLEPLLAAPFVGEESLSLQAGSDGTSSLVSADDRTSSESRYSFGSVGPLAPGAETLRRTAAGVPLLLKRKLESGMVLQWTGEWYIKLLAAAPAHRDIATWLVARQHFRSFAKAFPQEFAYYNYSDLVGAGEANMLPSLWVILAILLGYFIVVGPINLGILARKRRLELAWITIPVIVAITSGGVYVVSSRIKGSKRFHRSFTVLTGQSGASTLRADGMTMTFSPEAGTLKFTSGNTVAQSGISAWDSTAQLLNTRVNRARTNKTVVDVAAKPDGAMHISGMEARQWDTAMTSYQGYAQLAGPIIATGSVEGDKLTVTLQNRTAHAVMNPYVIIGNRAWQLDRQSTESQNRLLPGETAQESFVTGQSSFKLPLPFSSSENESYRAGGVAVSNVLRSLRPIQGCFPTCVVLAQFELPAESLSIPNLEMATDVKSASLYVMIQVDMGKIQASPARLDVFARPLAGDIGALDDSPIVHLEEGRPHVWALPSFSASWPGSLELGVGLKDLKWMRAEVLTRSGTWSNLRLDLNRQAKSYDGFDTYRYSYDRDVDLSAVSVISPDVGNVIDGSTIVRLLSSNKEKLLDYGAATVNLQSILPTSNDAEAK